MNGDQGEQPVSAGERAIRLLASGFVQDPVARSGAVLPAVPIHAPTGEFAGWFVGVAIEGRLVGFFHFDRDLRLRRYAAFSRSGASMTGCPRVADWLDPATIQARARTKAGRNAALTEPVLTYDGNPDRLAWAVLAMDRRGGTRTVYVAGDFVYLARRPTAERSTG